MSSENDELKSDEYYDGGNVRVIGMRSPKRVITKEDLIDVFSIDMNEWEFMWLKPNKWDGFYKNRMTENAVIVEMYQIKATLIRKNPIVVDYTNLVQPVNINIRKHKRFDNNKSLCGSRKTLVVTDAQIGYRKDHRTGKLDEFHSRDALSIVLQVAKQEKPDEIVVGGDYLDFSELTDKFAKEPGFFFTVQPSLEEGAWWLSQFRIACPNSKIYLLEGNHDSRLKNYYQAHVLSMTGLSQAGNGITSPPVMTVPYLLNLDKIGVEYIGDYPNEGIEIGGTMYIHGNVARGKPMATAARVAEQAQIDTVFEHIHRIETASSTKGDGKIVTAYCCGCLCRLDFTVPGHSRGQQWQNGFGITYYNDESRNTGTYRIDNNSAIVNGTVYRSRDVVDQLCNDTGWDFSK